MQQIILVVLLLSSSLVYSQSKETEKILQEGKLLFRLEKASWYGTDNMRESFTHKIDSIGGYLSYETADNKVNTIFFGRYDVNKILIRYEFDSLPTSLPLMIDTINHTATNLEKELIAIRQDTRDRAYKNEDSFFKFYDNTSLNIIPLIIDKERSVFVITGPQEDHGYVILGNDYKLSYNKKNKLKNKEKIHNSILQFPYTFEDASTKTFYTVHSHVISPFISSTDICSLLLYKDYCEWKQHIVISDKQVSVFDLEKESLFTMERAAWEKIYNSVGEKE